MLAEVKNRLIRAEKVVTNEEVIAEQIKAHNGSTEKQSMYDGIMYYRRKNTYISNIEQYRKNKLWSTNHKVGSGFFKKIVDQKINYLLGKPVVLLNADNINEIFDINKIIKKTAKESSKKGVEWLHTYINKQGEFKCVNISGMECIPIWDTEYEEELLQLIRYYEMKIIVDGQEKTRYKVELWDKEKVTYYMQEEDDNFYLDVNMPVNPLYHYSLNTTLGSSVVESESFGWGKVPFIPLWNNDDRVNDLEALKPDIDLYDVTKSDFANNIDRFQDALLCVKNHSAESYDKFLEILKKHGVIELDEDGEVSWLTLEIPVEARKTFLEIVRDDIFESGQAVDTRRVADGNTTNVVIKSRYADLDLKCDDLEAETDKAIMELCWFINKYAEITGNQQDDLDKIEIQYNRNIIFNTSEMIDNVLKSKGIVSDETALSMHPDVDNVEDELIKIAKDRKKEMDEFNDDPFQSKNNQSRGIQED